MLELKNDITNRVITLTANGSIKIEEMRVLLKDYTAATEIYKGRPHFLLADMRGLKPLSPELAKMMGEAIAFGRSHGIALCAHLSDSGVMRLQSNRLAREAAPNDEGTVEVVSPEEAHRLFAERRGPLLRR